MDDFDFKHDKDFTLDLSHNRITNVSLKDPIYNNFEERFLKETRSFVVLLLNDNPVMCDCYLYEFLRYLDGSMKKVREQLTVKIGQMKCFGPQKYEGILLSDLNSKSYKCIPTREEIDEYENCPHECDKWLRPEDKTFIFNCAYKNLSEAPEKLCSLIDKEHVKELDLTGNKIKMIPSFQQIGYNDVTRLTLSHNQISMISTNALSNNSLKVSVII